MDSTESHFFKAVVSIRRMELDEAMSSIFDCRKEMDPTEFEEIIAYLKTFTHKNNVEVTLLSAPTSSSSTSTSASRRKQSTSSLIFVFGIILVVWLRKAIIT
ncbi:hypothetical protein PsorP6_006837 [Peronosclerospora sorghi]|uniref:Uncharacterized protein n=1 Tax=Peronosclerospora sorghi TaxID=230839 RepID=A0ACC0W9V9_9STRA|nr:hypothetical protein PsorP6_006837 [Peronosclerospora sorghi]